MLGKKSSVKSAKKRFLYSHEYRGQKMGRGEMREANFPESQCEEKMLGKNRRKRVRQIVFYIHTNIVFKKRGQKNARNNFSRNTRIVRAKNVWEKNLWKILRKSFFYIHTNTVTKKWGGKKSAKQFFQKHKNNASKK